MFDKFVYAVVIGIIVAIASPIVIVMLPFDFVKSWSLLEFAATAAITALVTAIFLACLVPDFLGRSVKSNDESLEDYARYRGDIQ